MSKRTIVVLALGAILALVVGWQVAAFASHPEASLPGSNFEIDVDANLKVDDPAPPSLDWANVNPPDEIRAIDRPTGPTDDSYQGGVKEDTTCPDEVDGSIPNNKSDLRTFHVYEEAGNATNPAGYLNLAWSRVTDPSGTTLMDFEFNQSQTTCGTGPNKVRTPGDLLIEYTIDQGGARADITARTWNGSAWGAPQDLDEPSATCGGQPCATGTINQTAITEAEADGIDTSPDTELAPRTFGEAQLDQRLFFQPNKCVSFGSAMLKSRSSDAFTSQLKDFIRPVGVNITNCGQVIIHKQTDPADPDPTFNFEKSFNTDPSTNTSFSLQDDGTQTFTNVLFGQDYTVKELLGDNLPAGWEFVDVTCGGANNPQNNVTPDSIVGEVVTFDIDNESDVLECTFNNRARGTIIVEKITDGGFGAFDFTSNTLTPSPFTLTTTSAGAGSKDSETFTDLTPGTFDVAETVPAGWDLTSSTCSDGSNPASIGLSAGETVTCTFTDTKRGKILIDKVTDPSGDSQLFDFTLTGGPSELNQSFQLTDAATPHDSGAVKPGSGYKAAETVPAGWDNTEASCDDGSPVTDIDVSAGETVTCTFTNVKKTTAISTEQSFTPQDKATITGTGTGTPDGLVDFELYKGEDCDTGELVYFERNVSLNGSDTASTHNDGDPVDASATPPDNIAGYTISDEGTSEYHWKVSYHGDTTGHPDASSCVEESTVTIDNDNSTP